MNDIISTEMSIKNRKRTQNSRICGYSRAILQLQYQKCCIVEKYFVKIMEIFEFDILYMHVQNFEGKFLKKSIHQLHSSHEARYTFKEYSYFSEEFKDKFKTDKFSKMCNSKEIKAFVINKMGLYIPYFNVTSNIRSPLLKNKSNAQKVHPAMYG